MSSRKPEASPCVAAASRKRNPSISTAVSSLRRPRVLMEVNEPGPPSCCTRKPGTLRSDSATADSSRLSISCLSTTVIAFETSSTDCGVSDAVTTTVLRTPDNSREISCVADLPLSMVNCSALPDANPWASASTRYSPGASLSNWYVPVESVVVARLKVRSRP